MVNGHCERTIHAEENAICQAAMAGLSIAGGTMYVYLYAHTTDNYTNETLACMKCQQLIVAVGINEVVRVDSNGLALARKFAREMDWTTR
jgi:dCMP deaminase